MIDDEKKDDNMSEEEKDFWDKYGDQVPPEIDDEIDGENVLSLEELQEKEYEQEEEAEREEMEDEEEDNDNDYVY